MANRNEETEKTYFKLGEDWSVENVRKLDFGTLFTLKVGGLSLYNLRVVPSGKTADGKRYNAFVAPPEEKGKDGKWYKVYNISLTNADTADIIAEVDEILADYEEKASKKNRR